MKRARMTWRAARMEVTVNDAERYSITVILDALGGNPAFRKIDDNLFMLKQGSTFVMIHVSPFGERAVVRCAATLAAGAELSGTVAIRLLRHNTQLRFGAFAYSPEDQMVFFLHSILGGATLDPAELLSTLRDVAIVADYYDDWIVRHCGGKRMQDQVEDGTLKRILVEHANAFDGKEPIP